jgi:hypothetical protein
MNSQRTLIICSLIVALATLTDARASTLTTVPMQGPMVHVGIQYADHGDGPHLHIHVDTPVPVLMPLSVSHPGDQFDNTHPWFSDLDPSADAKAFNRQYGFVLDGDSDPLPTGYGIWIRQLTATLGLEVFRYRTSPLTWEPIFGTDGSSDTFMWNLGMFHPAYTAPAGSGTYLATYEAFVVDDLLQPTGVSETFTLEWQVIPEPTTTGLIGLGLGVAGWAARRRIVPSRKA